MFKWFLTISSLGAPERSANQLELPSRMEAGPCTSQLTVKVTFKVTLSVLVKDNVWVVYVL